MGIELADTQTRVGGLAVSRALGDHFLKQEKLGIIAEPFVSPAYKLADGPSILIVASDGVLFHYFIIRNNPTNSFGML
jgi:protein phosphatase